MASVDNCLTALFTVSVLHLKQHWVKTKVQRKASDTPCRWLDKKEPFRDTTIQAQLVIWLRRPIELEAPNAVHEKHGLDHFALRQIIHRITVQCVD